MTDLLGLLSGIHDALARHGKLHISITDIDGARGAVDHRTGVIHIAPGLTLPETLKVLVEAVAMLAPVTEPVASPIAVGGGRDPSALMPTPRRLSAVREGP